MSRLIHLTIDKTHKRFFFTTELGREGRTYCSTGAVHDNCIASRYGEVAEKIGRGERIRTSGPCLPNPDHGC